jgi:hypothetical protein
VNGGARSPACGLMVSKRLIGYSFTDLGANQARHDRAGETAWADRKPMIAKA